MSPFETYKEYIALKNHFTKSSYDYFKYNGKSRLKVSSFESRKDKVFFQKLAKHKDIKGFLISNLLENPKTWIKDLAYSESAENTYQAWVKKQQSLTYTIKNDISKLEENFNDNFLIVNNNSHPTILRLYLGNEISFETLCILLKITKSKKYWDEKLEYDPVYQEIKLKIEKYTPFIRFDETKIKNIILDYFS